MKRTYILILALCVLAGAKAQKFYNLRYCLELGLQNNYDLRIAHNEEQRPTAPASPPRAEASSTKGWTWESTSTGPSSTVSTWWPNTNACAS